jgi:hypothetical protein
LTSSTTNTYTAAGSIGKQNDSETITIEQIKQLKKANLSRAENFTT